MFPVYQGVVREIVCPFCVSIKLSAIFRNFICELLAKLLIFNTLVCKPIEPMGSRDETRQKKRREDPKSQRAIKETSYSGTLIQGLNDLLSKYFFGFDSLFIGL